MKARSAELAHGPRFLQPEALNVAPALVGAPLGTPWRRLLAMAVDLAVVALLSGVSGMWLIAGLVLVVLQLRSRQRAVPAGRRAVVGWIGAALVLLLALQEAGSQWQAWRQPAATVVADDDEAAEPAAIPASASRSAAAMGVPPADVAAASASAPATASGPASARASAAASAPAINYAERIAQLESELAKARKPKKLNLKRQLSDFVDDIGAGLGWGIVYFSLLPAWWGGQTVGKKLLRLQIVELTGKPMTVMRCLKRYGGYAAGMATGGLGFVQMLWEPNRQALHDKAAHTAVIDLRVPQRPHLRDQPQAPASASVVVADHPQQLPPAG